MPAITWKCPSCGTVNSRHSGACMACGGAEVFTATRPAADTEMPTIKVEVAPPPSTKGEAPPVPVSSSTGARTDGPLFDSVTGRPTAGKVTAGPAATSSSRSSGGAAATAPVPPVRMGASAVPPPSAADGSATKATPSYPARTSASRPGTSTRGLRKFAVGKLLGVCHIVLFVSVIQAFLFRPQWGPKLMNWTYGLSVHIGARVSGATVESWQTNPVIVDSYAWASHLPWGLTQNIYFVLAIACLVMRLAQSMPGWLSLAVALPAALYGLLAGIAALPSLALYWPLTAATFIVAWIVVGNTVRRY